MLIPLPHLTKQGSQRGMMLLEALIAVIIFSLGILGLIGLQASSTTRTTQAKFRVDASQIANQRVSAMWVDQANLLNYEESDTDVPELPGGKRSTEVNVTGVSPVAGTNLVEVKVTVSWNVPGITDDAGNPITHSYVAVGQITAN